MYSRRQTRPNRSFCLFGPRRTGKTAWLHHQLPNAFGEEYPVAKRFLLHTGKERRHHAGIEIAPLADALRDLDRLLGSGKL